MQSDNNPGWGNSGGGSGNDFWGTDEPSGDTNDGGWGSSW